MIQAGTASQTQAMPVVQLSQNNLLRLILPVPESAVVARPRGRDRGCPGLFARQNISRTRGALRGQDPAVHANHGHRSRCAQSRADPDSRHVRRSESARRGTPQRALGSARCRGSKRPVASRLRGHANRSDPHRAGHARAWKTTSAWRSGPDCRKAMLVVVGRHAGLKDGQQVQIRSLEAQVH